MAAETSENNAVSLNTGLTTIECRVQIKQVFVLHTRTLCGVSSVVLYLHHLPSRVIEKAWYRVGNHRKVAAISIIIII
jgi:hypothetical protein